MSNEEDYTLYKYIRDGVEFDSLPDDVKRLAALQSSAGAYRRLALSSSLARQLAWRDSLVAKHGTEEKAYYEALLDRSVRNHLVFPYHLREHFDALLPPSLTTPVAYYRQMLLSMMRGGNSYDLMPNFTAQDCLRVLGIGRNEYIDIVNKCRPDRQTSALAQIGGFFRRTRAASDEEERLRSTNVEEALPSRALPPRVQHWWTVHLASAANADEVQRTFADERLRAIVDTLRSVRANATATLERVAPLCGEFERDALLELHRRDMVFFGVPIDANERLNVPMLDSFVMNRVQGDPMERLLYDIFVAVDERMSVAELAEVLDVPLDDVCVALSLYCRLSLATKLTAVPLRADNKAWHASWHTATAATTTADNVAAASSGDTGDALLESMELPSVATHGAEDAARKRRVAILFDSTLTAFLMMGQLVAGLKMLAVTMFERGKLSHDTVRDQLLPLLLAVEQTAEGEAQRYNTHAIALAHVLNAVLAAAADANVVVDMLRAESLTSLDAGKRQRLLARGYTALLSVCPSSREQAPLLSTATLRQVPIVGAPTRACCTPWWPLAIARLVGSGLVMHLFPCGSRVRAMPVQFRDYSHLRLVEWNAEARVVESSALLAILNDALLTQPVLVQGWNRHVAEFSPVGEADTETADEQSKSAADIVHIPFPFDASRAANKLEETLAKHASALVLSDALRLHELHGYVSFVRDRNAGSSGTDWTLFDCQFGLPLFDSSLAASVAARLENLSETRIASIAAANEHVREALARVFAVNHDPCAVGDEWPTRELTFTCQ